MQQVSPESLVTVLGVVYVHRKTSSGGDLYLTHFGMQHEASLHLENWYDSEWFMAHRERLEGTSAVFRVPTKPICGQSLDLVVKNCRIGEDVPGDTQTLLEPLIATKNVSMYPFFQPLSSNPLRALFSASVIQVVLKRLNQ